MTPGVHEGIQEVEELFLKGVCGTEFVLHVVLSLLTGPLLLFEHSPDL